MILVLIKAVPRSLILFVFTLLLGPLGTEGMVCVGFVESIFWRAEIARPHELEALRDNLAQSGLAIIKGRPFELGEDVLKVRLYHHVYLARQVYPGAVPLYNLLVTRHASGKEFRDALRTWTQTHVSGFELIFPHEIMSFREQAIKEGKLKDEETPGIDSRGYIDTNLYVLLVAEGKFPVADPHDIMAHLPSLLDRDFVRLFKRYSKFTYEMMKELGLPSEGDLFYNSRDISLVLSRKSMALSRLADFVSNNLRDFLPENFSFTILDARGSPNFLFGGNKPWNGIVDLSGTDRSNYPGEKGRRSFVYEITSDPVEFALERLAHQPGLPLPLYDLSGFVISRNVMGLFDEMSAHLKPYDSLGVSRDYLNGVVEKIYSGEGPSADVMFEIIQRQAALIHGHDLVAPTYNRAHRVRTFELMLDFFEAYRDWILEALPE